MKSAYKLTAKIVFPEGAAPGAGGLGNRQFLAKNGKDEIVLRGSALAGVLRTAYAHGKRMFSEDSKISRWFGSASEGDLDSSSFVQVADAVVNCETILDRTHNLINRHTGAAVKKGLFSLEAIPPMAGADLSITLKPGAGEIEEYIRFINNISKIMGNGLLVGGNSNRGIGRMIVDGELYLRSFDLDTLDGIADFLDAEYEERKTGVAMTGEPQTVSEILDHLVISLELGIPRGEDILVGDGQAVDYALKPQTVTFADGTEHWRIPGSSIRGIFRGWMTRLAARDDEKIRDSTAQWYELDESDDPNAYNPDFIGWGFEKPKDREEYQKNPEKLGDPILDLFGSMYKKGRIHITDAFSQTTTATDVQDRMHVAIDRFSGGSHEGALFQNQVLAGDRLRFLLSISLAMPSEKEVEWLIKTLRALHLGILNIGSAKGCGRLEIKSVSAKGCRVEAITKFAREVN